MKAMILAAGVGSRLGALTAERPKALIEIEGVTMLERVARRLIAAGVGELIVNLFHFGAQIEAFLKARSNFGIRVEFSREDPLLETGGGLKKAAPFFNDGRPFFLHNVDVLSDLDLGALYQAHLKNPALATLAVRKRETARQLLFDREGLLRGRRAGPAQGEGGLEALAFDGVHVISPEIFPKMTETGAFSLSQTYLRLAALGEKIRAFRADGSQWLDIGSTERLQEARLKARQKT